MEEDINKETEHEEDLEEPYEDSDEEDEVETLEFSLNDEEIEELIAKLQGLKDPENENKEFTFQIDDENELLISYEDSEESEENSEEEIEGNSEENNQENEV